MKRKHDMKTKKITVWITARQVDGSEELKVFQSHDEIFGLYDYAEQVVISETTWKRLTSGYTPVRYGNTIRAYSF